MVSGTMNCYLDEVGNFNSIKVLSVKNQWRHYQLWKEVNSVAFHQ